MLVQQQGGLAGCGVAAAQARSAEAMGVASSTLAPRSVWSNSSCSSDKARSWLEAPWALTNTSSL